MYNDKEMALLKRAFTEVELKDKMQRMSKKHLLHLAENKIRIASQPKRQDDSNDGDIYSLAYNGVSWNDFFSM